MCRKRSFSFSKSERLLVKRECCLKPRALAASTKPACSEFVINGSGSSLSHSLSTPVILLMSLIHSSAFKSTESISSFHKHSSCVWRCFKVSPRSINSLSLWTFVRVPLMRYMPRESIPYLSTASQHLTRILGTSTPSRSICSTRFTPKVADPPRSPFLEDARLCCD
jgi:hypothetical protein